MLHDPDSFRLILSRHARYPDRIDRVMRDLNPLFGFADAGSCPLEDASRLHRRRIAKTIAKAVGKRVADVQFVSRDRPFGRPEWMTDDAYRVAYVGGLRTSLGRDLGKRLNAALADTIDPAVRDSAESLRGDSSVLATDIVLGIVTHPDDPLRDDLEEIIEECIFHLLGLTLFCDPSQDDRLRGLVRLLPKAIPLGERADNDAIWLVLTA